MDFEIKIHVTTLQRVYRKLAELPWQAKWEGETLLFTLCWLFHFDMC